MNIEKIKNYNQKVLAVIGTVVVLISIFGLIVISTVAVTEISRIFSSGDQDVGILSDEKIEELQQENKRQQLISYENPVLIDTLNLIYLIPVSHKTLQSAEFIDDWLLNLSEAPSDYKSESRLSIQYSGDFNNLLIYDFKNGSVEKLFKERINFRDIQAEYFKDDILVVFLASTKDTYKDGVINQLDYKKLYLYSLKSKELKEISIENSDVSQINFVDKSKDLLLKFGIDHNKDGKFDEYTEPTMIMKYDYNTGVLINITSEKINRELQMKLEGTK